MAVLLTAGLAAAVRDAAGAGRFPVGVTTITFTKTSVTTGAPRVLPTVVWYPAVARTGVPEPLGRRDAKLRRGVTPDQRYSPMSSCAMPKWWAISWITVRRTSRRSSASSAHRTSWARLKTMTWSGWSSVASVRSGRATPT